MIVILKALLFPGFVFLLIYSTALAFADRKLYARLQNRQGPPWYQPIADFLKLLGKDALIPSEANHRMFRGLPLFALAAMATAFLLIPIWGHTAVFSFEGDLIVALYLLAIPTLASFLAGWYSRSLYATVGATRVLTQMFSYEVPLFLAVLAPTLLSGTWSLTGNTAFFSAHPLLLLMNLPAALTMLVAIQCKLERTPFDAPEAETEIVSGPLVEYGGRYLACFTLAKDCELTVLVSLFATLYMPFLTGAAWLDFVLYVAETLLVLGLLCLMRAVTARLRINQIVAFCWRILLPCALFQVILNLAVRGVLL